MGRVTFGKNDLQSWCEQNNRLDLLQEWDYEKNAPEKPADISFGGKANPYWICKNCGYKWQARVHNRTKKENPRGCPKCGKKKGPQNHRLSSIAKSGSFKDWYVVVSI